MAQYYMLFFDRSEKKQTLELEIWNLKYLWPALLQWLQWNSDACALVERKTLLRRVHAEDRARTSHRTACSPDVRFLARLLNDL